MTADELRALPATVDLMTAARALRCGRSLAYDLARRGRFPCDVLRLGNRYVVPTAGLLEALGITPDPLDHGDDHQPRPHAESADRGIA